MIDTAQYQRDKLDSLRSESADIIKVHEAWITLFNRPEFIALFDLGMQLNEKWYSSCNHLSLRFPSVSCENVMVTAIKTLLLPGVEINPQGDHLFKRIDIYDTMAYAEFPLSHFVNAPGVSATVEFSFPLPMVFAASSFVLKHQKDKYGRNRWGRLYLHDGRVKQGHSGKREVAEERGFKLETTRQEMFEYLLAKVMENEEKCLFTVTGDSLVGSMIKAQSDAAISALIYAHH